MRGPWRRYGKGRADPPHLHEGGVGVGQRGLVLHRDGPLLQIQIIYQYLLVFTGKSTVVTYSSNHSVDFFLALFLHFGVEHHPHEAVAEGLARRLRSGDEQVL